MIKSPAFQWYAADYLADERVMQLSLEAEACYVRLLNYCWREGTIPSNPAQCVPMCKYADVKVIKQALALFTKAANQPGRMIHKRLEEERGKQEAYRAKQAAKGAMGGRPRKADEKPEESHGKATALPQLNRGLTEGDLNESSSSSTSSTSTTDVVRATAGQTVKANSKADQQAVRAAAEGLDTFTADNWPGLNDPQTFALICKDLKGLKLPANLDTEAYREAIRQRVKDRHMDVPATTMRNFIEGFFMKLSTAELRTLDAAMPTVPTPRHELPQPGHERPGQVIAIAGVVGDVNMNRMKVEAMQNHFPTATIHAILPR